MSAIHLARVEIVLTSHTPVCKSAPSSYSLWHTDTSKRTTAPTSYNFILHCRRTVAPSCLTSIDETACQQHRTERPYLYTTLEDVLVPCDYLHMEDHLTDCDIRREMGCHTGKSASSGGADMWCFSAHRSRPTSDGWISIGLAYWSSTLVVAKIKWVLVTASVYANEFNEWWWVKSGVMLWVPTSRAVIYFNRRFG